MQRKIQIDDSVFVGGCVGQVVKVDKHTVQVTGKYHYMSGKVEPWDFTYSLDEIKENMYKFDLCWWDFSNLSTLVEM